MTIIKTATLGRWNHAAVDTMVEKKAPQFIRMTPMGRAMFGLENEMVSNPQRFLNATYLTGLLQQEAAASLRGGRAFLSLLILNSLAFSYVQGFTYKIQIFGIALSTLPGASVALCLFLGLALFNFSIVALDTMLLSRIRWAVVHRAIGTDLVNLATANLKGTGLWSDIWTPRFIGYASGRAHSGLSRVYLVGMMLFLASIFAASSVSLLELFQFDLALKRGPVVWSLIISSAGALMGVLGLVNFFAGLLIPMKFELPKQAGQAKPDLLKDVGAMQAEQKNALP
jgi:hypothetical protein